MPRAVVNGIRIHYLRAGQGPDVVMIHGLAANMAFWYLGIARRLTAAFRVTLYDLRGHGYSEAPPTGYTSADMAEDLDALLDHLDIEQAHLVGHSFGGTVALHYATLAPRRVRSLVLADVRVRPLQPIQRLRDGAAWREQHRRLADLGVAVSDTEDDVGHFVLEELARSKAQLPARPLEGRESLAAPFDRWLGRGAAERWLTLLDTTSAREDLKALAGLTRERIRAVAIPTLAIYGATSRCMPSLRRLAREMPRCLPVVVPGVGHFHPLLRPGVLVRYLRVFLRDPERMAAARRGARQRGVRARRLLALEEGGDGMLDAGQPA